PAGAALDNGKRSTDLALSPEAKPLDHVATARTMKAGEADFTALDTRGTYKERARPFDPNSETTPRLNYRMRAVVFGSAKGPYFIRLVGPADTVAHYQKGFEAWLKNVK